MKDIVLYVSLFTVGHSITLLAGVFGGIRANPNVIDAIIGLSVVYKAFDNMDGFRRLFGFEPNTTLAVLIFGLFHGFGLATKLQELDLSKNGLVTNIISFNVGVEIGQVLALTGVVLVLSYWRTLPGFFGYAFATNTALMVVGFVLVGYQVTGHFCRIVILTQGGTMVEQQTLPVVEAPSKNTIVKATGVAFAVAAVLLLTVVLPAEYGIDPLKTGALLGLTGLSKAAEPAAVGGRATPAVTGIYTAQPNLYKVDSEDLSLKPDEGVEIKYHMQKGAGMVYAWKATGNVRFEFHGEPDKKPNKDYFESYLLDDKVGQDHSYGSFAAPTTGIHGWFWANKGHKDVQIHLTTAGFYDSAKMFSDGSPIDLDVAEPK